MPAAVTCSGYPAQRDRHPEHHTGERLPRHRQLHAGTTFNDTSFSIPDIAITADGTFSGSAMQNGIKNGAPATFTYTVSGHFHGLDSSGHERAAGQIREDVTYHDDTAHTCTTGTAPVSMTWAGS
jgi:hypothetical protein